MPRVLTSLLVVSVVLSGRVSAQSVTANKIETSPSRNDAPVRKMHAGEVLLDRSECPFPFKIRILNYADKEGMQKKGPWKWDFPKLGPKTSRTTYLVHKPGQRIVATVVGYHIINDFGKTWRLATVRHDVNEDGELVIKVTEGDLPAFLVSESAINTDKELVELIMSSESMRFDDDEKMLWLNRLPRMKAMERSKLKEILMRERIKLAEADASLGLPAQKRVRDYKVAPDSEVRDLYRAAEARVRERRE